MNVLVAKAHIRRTVRGIGAPALSVCLLVCFKFIDWGFWQQIMGIYVCGIGSGALRSFGNENPSYGIILESKPLLITPSCVYADLLLAAAPFVFWGGKFFEAALRFCVFAFMVMSFGALRIVLLYLHGYWRLPWWVAHDVVHYSFWVVALGLAICGWIRRLRVSCPSGEGA